MKLLVWWSIVFAFHVVSFSGDCENLRILCFTQRSIFIAVSSLGSHLRFNAQDSCLIIFGIYNPYYQVLPIPMASRSNAWVWGSSTARTGGFESPWGHGCLSLASVVYCQVEVFASVWSLVQRGGPGPLGAVALRGGGELPGTAIYAGRAALT